MSDTRDVVERFNAAWEQGDVAAVGALLAEDVIWTPTAWDGPAVSIRGRAAVIAAIAGELGAGPALGPVEAAGDRVVCAWAWPSAADGSTLRGVDVYRLRDGLIAEKDVYSKIVARA